MIIDQTNVIRLIHTARSGDMEVVTECAIPLEFIRDTNLRTPSEKAVEAWIIGLMERAKRAPDIAPNYVTHTT